MKTFMIIGTIVGTVVAEIQCESIDSIAIQDKDYEVKEVASVEVSDQLNIGE